MEHQTKPWDFTEQQEPHQAEELGNLSKTRWEIFFKKQDYNYAFSVASSWDSWVISAELSSCAKHVAQKTPAQRCQCNKTIKHFPHCLQHKTCGDPNYNPNYKLSYLLHLQPYACSEEKKNEKKFTKLSLQAWVTKHKGIPGHLRTPISKVFFVELNWFMSLNTNSNPLNNTYLD